MLSKQVSGFVLSILVAGSLQAGEIATTRGEYDRRGQSGVGNNAVIDLDKQIQKIDRSFYGSFVESRAGLPNTSLIQELQLGALRVGGNEYDVFNWQNGMSFGQNEEFERIQKYEELAPKLQSLNTKGIFQINLTGYQPEWNGNGYNVVRSFDSKAAYELVKHLNGTLKLGIKAFSLGNEFEQWHYTHSAVWHSEDGVSADEYIERYIEFVLAIRKAQAEVSGDPNSIEIWGPEFSGSWMDWNTGNFSEDCEWSDIPAQVNCSYAEGKFTHFIPYFLSRLQVAEADPTLNPNGYKFLDKFAFHYYPNFRKSSGDVNSIHTDNQGKQIVAEMLAGTQVLHSSDYVNKFDLSSYKNFSPNIIPRMRAWINRYYPKADLVNNEFAFDSDYRTTNYHPIVRPLYLADTVGIMAKEGVTFFNKFILSSPADNGDIPWALIKQGRFKTDLFQIYKLYTNNFKGSVVETKDNAGDILNTYATVSGDSLNVMVVNKEPYAQTVEISVKENGSVKKLTTYTAPAWSLSVLKMDKSPGLFTRRYEILQYGAKEMGIKIDMTYAKK